MNTPNRIFTIARRTLALSALLGAGLIAAQAQEAAATPATTTTPTLNLQVPTIAPPATFSSSSQDNEVAVADNHFDFLAVDNAQPTSRRYGRPRYRGGNTNPDGSNKWAFLAGAGFTVPVGTDSNYLKTSYGFQVGGGRNFNKNLGVLLQFDWDNFGLTSQSINKYANDFFDDPTNQNGFDANSHIWSFTLNPTFNIFSGETFGAYAVVGGGFYHKTANVFIQVPSTYCDPFYGCYQYAANETVQNYTSNSAGVNGGLGLTYKMSHFANQRLYAEFRVVHTFNKYRPESVVYNDGSVSGWNFLPENSQETTYFPVKFGIRF
jgi:hypothetical protein